MHMLIYRIILDCFLKRHRMLLEKGFSQLLVHVRNMSLLNYQ